MKASKIEDRDWVTRMNEYRYKDAKRLVENFENDPSENARKERQLCKHCYYVSGFAGQAFTMSECIKCKGMINNPNTDVDVMCLDCAKETDSCKHCGGAID